MELYSGDKQTCKRFNSIDIAKGICIIFVIITHFDWTDQERMKYLFPFWIDLAVPIFMVISGFVNAKSFVKRGNKSIGDAFTSEQILEKVIRYSIPFIIAFLFEEIFYNYVGIVDHSLRQIVKTFFCGGFGPGSYYFPIMIQFIFYFPILFSIIRKYDFYGLFICFLINISYEMIKFFYSMNEECYRLLLFRYTLPIAYGCYLALSKNKRHYYVSVICSVIGGLYIIICKYCGVSPLFTNYWTGTSVWACLFIIPISAPLILNKTKNRCLEMIGKASYDIFLVQMVYYNAARIMYEVVKYRIIQLVINIVLCVSVGIMFHYFEVPLTKNISRIVNRIIKHLKHWITRKQL